MIDIFSSQQPQTETGVVVENMLDGYYRVNVSGQIITARDQSGASISVGSITSVTRTTWGNFIVSSSGKATTTREKIIIQG